jgi:hypothetical protein
MARCRHRIDGDRCFLPLKLIDGADAGLRQTLLYLEHLGVVGRDDEDDRFSTFDAKLGLLLDDGWPQRGSCPAVTAQRKGKGAAA